MPEGAGNGGDEESGLSGSVGNWPQRPVPARDTAASHSVTIQPSWLSRDGGGTIHHSTSHLYLTRFVTDK